MTADPHLYVAHLSRGIANLGPGRRLGLWLQGCDRHCPGCISPGLFERNENDRRSISAVANTLVALAPGHRGLTVSGGEPFDQAATLLALLRRLRRETELDFLVYTGYTLEALAATGGAHAELLEIIDLLIDGPYREELPGTLLWRGSDNQRLHLLSVRAAGHETYRHAVYDGDRPLHFELAADGSVCCVGIPERGFRERFTDRLADRGIVTGHETGQRPITDNNEE